MIIILFSILKIPIIVVEQHPRPPSWEVHNHHRHQQPVCLITEGTIKEALEVDGKQADPVTDIVHERRRAREWKMKVIHEEEQQRMKKEGERKLLDRTSDFFSFFK